MSTVRIVVSPHAKSDLEAAQAARGRQVVIISSVCSAPSIVHVRRYATFFPREHERLVGNVVGCPVYADAREFESCPHKVIVLDSLGGTDDGADEPVLLARPESEAEREERVFGEFSTRDRVG